MPHLSIVIPSYNEERRLPKTLRRMLPYLRAAGFRFEILISDDGSTDRTVVLIREMIKEYPEIRVISDGVNRGRGAAVKRGVFESLGELILETDSDGSVADEAIGRFVAYMDLHPEIAMVSGSREMAGALVAARQPRLRVFLGYGFLFLTRLLFRMWKVTDFTLGFKMYRNAAARDIFANQFDPFYVAEAEKIFVASVRGYRTAELPVTWYNDEDSRVRPVRDSIRSLYGLIAVLARYATGEYHG